MTLELTFHTPSKRWKKVINGKQIYFGYGQSKDDILSYRQALAKMLDFKCGVTLPASPTIILNPCMDVPVTETVGSVHKRYTANQEARYLGGEITCRTYLHFERCSLKLSEFVGMEKPISAINEKAVEEYQNHILKWMAKNKLSKVTANHFLRYGRSYIMWCWERHLIELPRNLKRLRITCDPPKPKTYTLEEVQTLWKNATPRVRLFIGLALLTGAGQNEIATMQKSELVENHLVRNRTKTGVPSDHWIPDWLVKMILDNQTKKGELMFMTRENRPLVWHKLVKGKEQKSDSIPIKPVIEVVSVQYYPVDGGSLVTLPTDCYRVNVDDGYIVFDDFFPCLERRENALQITFKAGYYNPGESESSIDEDANYVPEHLKQAIRLLAGEWFKYRENFVDGRIAPISVTVDRLLRL